MTPLKQGNYHQLGGKWRVLAHALHVIKQEEAKGNLYPWELTKEMDAINNEIMSGAKAESSLEIILKEYFDIQNYKPFNAEEVNWIYGKRKGIKQPSELRQEAGHNSRLISPSQMLHILQMDQDFSEQVRFTKVAEMIRVLRAFSAEYTNSLNIGIPLGASKLAVCKDGQLIIPGKADKLFFIPSKGA